MNPRAPSQSSAERGGLVLRRPAAPVAHRRTARLVDDLRAGVKPTMAANIACIASLEEMEAFRSEYLARRGPLPTDVFRAIANRRREIEQGLK